VSLFALLGIALAATILVMTLVWLLSVRLRNAGIVDVAWSAMFTLLALIHAGGSHGWIVRRVIAATLMSFWSLRLASHLWRRVVGHIETEDVRYAALRESWGAHANQKMLFFFWFQGLSNVALSVPVLIASRNATPRLHPLEIAGAMLFVVSVIGEAIADAQLRRFRADPANKGRVMNAGLWRLSRHPNYFFEWLVWIAWLVVALASPHGWIVAYCPLLMLWFLYKVTGIPATEAHSLQSKGDAYRRYQQTTSAFIPWFPKKQEHS
jgi:steroid 5-alpha reductase family enzyme